MKKDKITFNDLGLYFYNLGLNKYRDYSIDFDNKIIELSINKIYCVSIWDDGTNVEVFKSHVGAKVDSQGVYITDGKLHSYKTFKSLSCAMKFALKIKNTGLYPNPEKIY